MRYHFKKYKVGCFLVIFTDFMAPSYKIFDLEEHKNLAFVDRWPDAVLICRMVHRSGAIIV